MDSLLHEYLYWKGLGTQRFILPYSSLHEELMNGCVTYIKNLQFQHPFYTDSQTLTQSFGRSKPLAGGTKQVGTISLLGPGEARDTRDKFLQRSGTQTTPPDSGVIYCFVGRTSAPLLWILFRKQTFDYAVSYFMNLICFLYNSRLTLSLRTTPTTFSASRIPFNQHSVPYLNARLARLFN